MRLRPRSSPNRSGARHNPARAAKQKATIILTDSSTEDEVFESQSEDVESRDLSPPTPPTRTARVTRSVSNIHLSPKHGHSGAHPTPTKKQPRISRRLPRRNRAQPTRTRDKTPVRTDAPTGVIPDWASLPYAVLVSIFDYASEPIRPTSSQWLVDVACLCQAFAEPALTALYRSPAITQPQQAHKLVQLLSNSASQQTKYSYHHKVKSLSLDVGAVVAPVYQGAHIDLLALFQNIPSVTDVKIFHQKDLPPYRQLSENIRWVYNDALFQGLGVDAEGPGAGPRLRSWEWNSRLLRKMSFARVREIHRSRAFKSLRKVQFVNFQSPSLTSSRKLDKIEEEDMDRKFAEELATCIVALPDLEHLAFESSTCVNGLLLPMLPRNLKTLELVNCGEVRSDELGLFLQSHGHNLEVLILQHNQALSLSFLPFLGEACPKLREFRVNLNYFRVYEELDSDSNPCYDWLLTAQEVPNWPSTLEVIDIDNMRQWESDTATMFFKSLADNAPQLPMLRRLSIKARLTSVSWRERSTIRDLWVEQLEKIYLRPWNPPAEYRSLRDCQPVAPAQSRPEQLQGKRSPSAVTKGRSTRSQRILKRPRHVSYKDPDTDEDDDTDSNAAVSRKKQKCGLGEASALELMEISDVSDVDAIAGDVPGHEAKIYAIQGMCNVVDITIDNQKPVEMQFVMDDFMDGSEGEESEWDGHDPDDMPGYAW